MTATAFGEQRPPLRPVAEQTHLMLEVTQLLGMLPAHLVLRVYAIEEDLLLVAVGGLDDRFLLGDRADLTELAAQSRVEPQHYTTAALRVWREVEATADHAIPRVSTGAAWFELRVWMQTEHWWRKCATTGQPEGVIEAKGGELLW